MVTDGLEGHELKLKEELDKEIASFNNANTAFLGGIVLGIAITFFIQGINTFLADYFGLDDPTNLLFFAILFLLLSFSILIPFIKSKNRVWYWYNRFFSKYKWHFGY